MFGFEPAPVYVFGTDVRMTPDLGDEGTTTSPFHAPVDAYAWKRQSDVEQKKWKLEKATLEPETIRSPVDRSYSAYYGPGHAVVLGVLDRTRPPFQEVTEARPSEAACRAVARAVAPSPAAARKRAIRADRETGLGDTAVHIDGDGGGLATLYLALNIGSSVPPRAWGMTGYVSSSNGFSDTTAKNNNPWARLEKAGLAHHPPTSLNCQLGKFAYDGLSAEDRERRNRGAVQGFLVAMQAGLARELALRPPEFVGAEELFPGGVGEGERKGWSL
ncbi:hypothetical protein PG997_013981 [Apiospora hydei]|uniref:Uncharacterized protein n=1 Tax=Apiospora hydei TaxID=1337664 RepID=A0ABR1VB28_9PEZI